MAIGSFVLLAYAGQDECIARGPSDYCRLGFVYSRRGDFDKPLDYYRDSVKDNPDDARAHYQLGVAYETRGEADKAIGSFQEAIRLDPGYWEAYRSLGDIYGVKGEYDKEMLYLKEALRLNPDDGGVYYIPMVTFGRRVYYDKAREYFERSIRLDPGCAEAYYGLGRLYEKISRINPANPFRDRLLAKAGSYLKKAFELDPQLKKDD